MTEDNKIGQGTLIPIPTDEVEQDDGIRDATKAALELLRTTKIEAFALCVIEDSKEGTTQVIIGKKEGVHNLMVVGMLEDMKFVQQHSSEKEISENLYEDD